MTFQFSSIMKCFAGFLFLAVAACQTAPDVEPRVLQSDGTSRPIASAPSTPTSQPVSTNPLDEYRLGPSDRVRITVFGEPELSGEYVVDAEGFVSLNLIREVRAQGLTVREFQRTVEQKLSPNYLRDAKVSAEVLNFRPYYILGEVNRPGEYPYSNGLTVLNAIATAEGFTYRANKKVVLIKGSKTNSERQMELTPSIRVEPGDTIRIKERLF